MKKLLLTLIVIWSTAALTLTASDKTKRAKSEKDPLFDMVGTVVKYESGICMEGSIHYGLKSLNQNGQAWLSASAADYATLKTALEHSGWVHVKGNWHQGTECRYVKVTSVHPVKKK
jgi:hypothetical protein